MYVNVCIHMYAWCVCDVMGLVRSILCLLYLCTKCFVCMCNRTSINLSHVMFVYLSRSDWHKACSKSEESCRARAVRSMCLLIVHHIHTCIHISYHDNRHCAPTSHHENLSKLLHTHAIVIIALTVKFFNFVKKFWSSKILIYFLFHFDTILLPPSLAV